MGFFSLFLGFWIKLELSIPISIFFIPSYSGRNILYSLNLLFIFSTSLYSLLKPAVRPVLIYCHLLLFLKYRSIPFIPVSGIWSMLKLFSNSHLAVITDELDRNLIDNPAEFFDKSQTGSRTSSL